MGKSMAEHLNMATFTAEYSNSSFEYALLGAIPPPSHVHSNELLEDLARIIKPSTEFVITEPVATLPSS